MNIILILHMQANSECPRQAWEGLVFLVLVHLFNYFLSLLSTSLLYHPASIRVDLEVTA